MEQETEEHNELEDYKVRPLQLFISKFPFPYRITGSDLADSTDSGRPWYNGVLFEDSRTLVDAENYISSLPSNHNLIIDYQAFNIAAQHYNIFYKLFYPGITGDQIYSQISGPITPETTDTYRLEYELLIDFVCDVNSPNIFGFGENNLEGFINVKFNDRDNASETVNLFENTVREIDERLIGQFTSSLGTKYYFMLDYGTDIIRGKA